MYTPLVVVAHCLLDITRRKISSKNIPRSWSKEPNFRALGLILGSLRSSDV